MQSTLYLSVVQTVFDSEKHIYEKIWSVFTVIRKTIPRCSVN